MTGTAATVCGADGCPGGWLAVIMPADRPDRAEARIVPAAKALLDTASTVAIDVPIGLMDTPDDGARPADAAARRVLRDRNSGGVKGPGSRVFATPTRAQLDAFRADPDYTAFRRTFPPPRSLSKQCWNICGKIAELDDLLSADPDAPIWESHPEVAFAVFAGKTLPSKKSRPGARARQQLLRKAGFELLSLARALPRRRRHWAPDDLLDACVLALSASRIARGAHAGLPNLTERDSRGLRRSIHY